MKDLRKLFKDRLNEIENNKNFVDTIFQLNNKASKSQINKIEKEIGRKLPPGMLDFYSQMNGLYMSWRYRVPGEPYRIITGKSEIRSIDKVFTNLIEVFDNGDWKDDVFWSRYSKKEEIELFNNFMVLDELDNGNYIIFKINNDQEPDLYLYSHCNRYYPLDISFSEYVDLLFKTCGMYLWQEYVTRPATFEKNREIPDNFHDNMKLLFPETDLSRFGVSDKLLTKSNYNIFFQKKEKIDYKALFLEKVEELNKNKKLIEINFEPGKQDTTIGTFRKVKEATGRELPVSMYEFYTSINGFDLEWELEGKNDEIIRGQIHMQPLEDVFGGYNGKYRKDWDDEVFKNILWMEDYEKEDITFMKPFKIIDTYEGESRDVVIRFIKKEPELFLRDKWEYQPLSISFSEYVNLLLETLGLEYWQDSYISKR